MSLFNRLVDEALANQPRLGALRVVVEKELLHHDILREMSAAGLLAGLTFIGGTCLRVCYGANRLSEDLDFTGGADFSRESLHGLGRTLEEKLQDKYGLAVTVSEPVKDTGNVDTWKLKIITRPERPDVALQRINLDICTVPSHDARPMMLRNPYGVEMGTAGLVVNAESREEIFADKIVALALRPNRLKNRDLWDIAWLAQQGVSPPLPLLPLKLKDHHCNTRQFLDRLHARNQALQDDTSVAMQFKREMQRFLPVEVVRETVENPGFWPYLAELVGDHVTGVERFFSSASTEPAPGQGT